ncbi:MAG: PilZ domain-containing protein [Bryobacterales bacterium]|nr:PilZ domain-containing protein [Bryobacterales bacterium]MBV9400328.1 PilZ domain-containing protein [Bryobacterales bacterium]
MATMMDRRIEPRMLCADLVEIEWKDLNGRRRREMANLEDISLSGACIQIERPVPLGTPMRIHYPSGELTGTVQYCVFREIGYFLGIEFNPGNRWSQRAFRPQHLLDPRKLVARVTHRIRGEGATRPN